MRQLLTLLSLLCISLNDSLLKLCLIDMGEKSIFGGNQSTSHLPPHGAA